jgi:hypothetical protein
LKCCVNGENNKKHYRKKQILHLLLFGDELSLELKITDGKRLIIKLSVSINHFETPIRFSERFAINLSYLYAI